MIAIILNAEKRVSAVSDVKHRPLNSVVVDKLPKGNYNDYKYLNGNYVYDPLPKKHITPEPTIEERLSDVELILADWLGGALQ